MDDFERVYAEHNGKVRRWVGHILRQYPHDVEDVVQETFIRVLRSTFRGESQITTWLYRIAVNEAVMFLRKKAARPSEIDAELPELLYSEPGFARVENKQALEKALMGVSPRILAVAHARCLEELSLEETAARMGRSVGNVKSIMNRDLRKRTSGKKVQWCEECDVLGVTRVRGLCREHEEEV